MEAEDLRAQDHHNVLSEIPDLPQKQLLWNFLMAQGSMLFSTYISALLKVPPRDVSGYFVDTLVVLSETFMEGNQASGWMEAAL